MKKLTLLLLLACTTMFAQKLKIVSSPDFILVNTDVGLLIAPDGDLGDLGGIGFGYEYRYLWTSGTTEWKKSGLTKSLRINPRNISVSIYNPTPRTVELRLFTYKGYYGPDRGERIAGSESESIEFRVSKIRQSAPLQPEVSVTPEVAPPPPLSEPGPAWEQPVIDDSCPAVDGEYLEIIKAWGQDGADINALRITTSGEIKVAFDIKRFEGLDDDAVAYHEYLNLANPNAEWKRSEKRDAFEFTIQTATGTKTHTVPAYTDEFTLDDECDTDLYEFLLADIHQPGPRAVRVVVGDYTSKPFEFVIDQEEYVCSGSSSLTINLVGKLKRDGSVKLKVTNLTGYNLGYSYIHQYRDNRSLSGPLSRMKETSSCVQDYTINITTPDALKVKSFFPDEKDLTAGAVLVRVFPLKEGLTEADWKDVIIKL